MHFSLLISWKGLGCCFCFVASGPFLERFRGGVFFRGIRRLQNEVNGNVCWQQGSLLANSGVLRRLLQIELLQ